MTDGLQWRVKSGTYQATVRLSASGPINVEVWNDTCGKLLSRRTMQTVSEQPVTMPVSATADCVVGAYPGWGLFRAHFIPPPTGQILEVRVWSPGGERVNVYSASLRPVR